MNPTKLTDRELALYLKGAIDASMAAAATHRISLMEADTEAKKRRINMFDTHYKLDQDASAEPVKYTQ